MTDVASALAQEPGVEPVLFNPLAFGRNALRSAVASALALPGRALTAAGDLQRTGDQYDPAPAVDAAMMTMGGTAFGAPKGAMGAGPPIRAYHGSPYDFERFDMSKIGTGEGAQAYGHGLYFAENPAVAADYRRILASKANLSGASRLDAEAMKYIHEQGGLEQAKAALDAEIKQWGANSSAGQYFQAVRNAVRLQNPGRMYEVNINAAPEHFLDWDKPMGQQPDIAAKVKAAGLSPATPDLGSFGGQPILGAPRWADTPQAAAALNEAGIPGIRYLDQGSRSGSAGSSNYVVFNDKLIDILRKYQIAGIAPPAALLAAAQQGGGEQQ